MKRFFLATFTAVALLAVFSVFSASHRFNRVEAQGKSADAPGIVKKIFELNPHGLDNVTAGSTGQQTPVITYHGGALINTPTAYIIWYGNWNQTNGTDNAGGQQIVRDFLTNLGGSNYYSINKTYSAGGYTITGGVNFIAGTNETSDAYSSGKKLNDSSILTIVNRALNNGSLPYNPDGVYFVLTSSDVAETSGFCSNSPFGYCGWHTAGSATTGHVRYAFVGNAARCLSGCAAQSVSPNGNAGVDGMISVIAHELEEANTDPDPRSGWADSNGSENADKCAWTFGSHQTTLPNGAVYNVTLGARNFLIQRNLSATDSKCYIDGVLGLQ